MFVGGGWFGRGVDGLEVGWMGCWSVEGGWVEDGNTVWVKSEDGRCNMGYTMAAGLADDSELSFGEAG